MKRGVSTRLRVSHLGLAVSGALTAALGLTVLVGWSTRNLSLIQVHPNLAPMTGWTALNFVLLGAGMLLFALGRRVFSAALAAIGTVLNLLAVMGWLTALGFDLDRLLRIPLGLPVKPVPPNTAVCIILLSMALLLMSGFRSLHLRATLPALLASVAASIAAASLIGYGSGLKTFEWGPWSPMSVQGAGALMLLGSGVLLFSWRDGRSGEPGLPPWAFLSATLVAAVFTVSLWQALAADASNQVKRAIAADLAEVRADIRAQIQLRTAVLSRAARRWERLAEPTQADWEFEASLLLSDYLGFRAVEWVDPNLRIRLVAPWKGNERLRDADLSFEPRRRAAFENARRYQRPVLVRTVDLLTGGRGIQIYVPVFRGGSCTGFVAGIFLVDELIPQLVPATAAPGEQIAIFDGGEQIYSRSAAGSEVPAAWEHRIAAELDGPTWTLQMRPAAAKLAELRSRVPGTVLGAGLLVSALLGVVVFLAQQAAARARAAEALRKAVQTEVSERLHAEQQLDQFFALSLEMLCIAGVDGYFKRINPAFERVLGFSAQQLQQEPFLKFVHPDDREATAAAVRELGAGVALARFENRYRTREGSYRWLEWSSAPARDQPLIFASARDITELKTSQAALQVAHAELEERVRQRTAALEQSNRALARSEAEVVDLNRQLQSRVRDLTAANQELEAFTYSVSHDLRAPLRHVDGFSKILLEDYGAQLPEAARPLVDRIRQGSQRMGRMVDELLELSRTSRREPEKRLTGLRSLVNEVIADLATETSERDVEWRIGDLPFADCDPALTRQIFANLLSNALKFTRPRPAAVIAIGQTIVAGEPALFVRDNGVGFSMKYAEKLFGPFQRLHRQEDFEGTGVGLATVQRIVHKHGGRIWAEATLDEGATFYFTLEPHSRTLEAVAEPAVVSENHDVQR